jgi:hypothetical protein
MSHPLDQWKAAYLKQVNAAPQCPSERMARFKYVNDNLVMRDGVWVMTLYAAETLPRGWRGYEG